MGNIFIQHRLIFNPVRDYLHIQGVVLFDVISGALDRMLILSSSFFERRGGAGGGEVEVEGLL